MRVRRKRKKPNKVTPGAKDKLSKRLVYIHSRIKSLTKENNKLNYEGAFKIASEEYKNHKKESVPADGMYKSVPLPTGELIILDEPKANKMMCHMLSNVIHLGRQFKRRDGEMMFNTFNETGWEDLLRKITEKSREICRHFNCTNKLKLNKAGTQLWLSYG